MKALVVFASLTGNTEEIADVFTEALENLGIETEMEECSSVYGEDFLDYDICAVATYTYGTDADLPDEIVDLYEDLAELDLGGKIFATMGSGDHFYEKFCQSVLDFEARFLEQGATQAGPSVLVDLNPEAEDIEALENLAQQCQAKVLELQGGE
ncbi:flavodoxin [Aerococcus urinaehominis]|uniref:Flavodoxin n=1 Tax=Aerococcus urinaehominis TaxID=128944 RepID=A0A0X8FLK1_9LACT|nr:flavodoxin [Aerococcus urinaehominis]AMB99557.1 flavodoxin [Aerococcus urinaehominis]SDM35059.1 flavodoxin, short chain [Aerococcus urinaehominis]